jgi:filamentous hemagglutinin
MTVRTTPSAPASRIRRRGRRGLSRLLCALLARLAWLLRPPVLRLRLRAGAAGWSLLAVAAGLQPWSAVQAQTVPPVPAPRVGLPNECIPGVCGPNVRFNPVGGVTLNATSNALTINQTTGTAVLNWQNFNIANGNTVTFRQPDANSVALNRIYDPNVSRIDGNLFANGQIYLINPNGLLFGSTARVDVGGLIASTLNVSDERIRSGLLSDPRVASPVFRSGLEENSAANPNGRIDIFSGAQIFAAGRDQDGTVIRAGNVFLFAPEINNAGSIQVDAGGQVIFAAGQRIFLTGSNTPTLRGLLVEVGEGGTVTHSGEISSARGNVTLMGMAVNQAGRISATSALRENGSIRLIARQVGNDGSSPLGFTQPEPTYFLQVGRTGQVNVASGSRTEVVLDATDRATAPLNDTFAAQARSSITVEGGQVQIGGSGSPGATLLQARGGDITVSARRAVAAIGSSGQILGTENETATVNVGSDAKIDVSGERDVAVDGARNFVYIERLTSSDLRDAPTQRDGFLRGQGVHVNVAQDHPFIDLSSRRGAVAGTQAERNATAGTIAIRAEGSVDVASGAVFDVSGGSTITSTASGRTSQLIDENGRIVDITQASADARYVGFADTFTRDLNAPREGVSSSTRFDAPRSALVGGFTEGKAAGTVEIIAPRGTLGAQIVADTVTGTQQRGAPPAGGTLRIGGTGDNSNLDGVAEISRAHVLIANDTVTAAGALTSDQRNRLIAVDAKLLGAGRVTKVAVVSDGMVKLAGDTPLDLGAYGSLSVDANAVEVGASVTAAGGSIRIAERPLSSNDAQGVRREARNLVDAADRGTVRFGVGVTLDTSGRFSNDSLLPPQALPTTPVVRNGGSIDISGRRVDLSTVTRLAVDAGASVNRSGSVSGGRAGTIALRGSETSSGLGIASDPGSLVLGAGFEQRISGFGFSAGGGISIVAPRVQIGGAASLGETGVSAALFDRGFETFTLRGTDSLRVALGAVIKPSLRRLVADPDVRLAASGTSIMAVARAEGPLPTQQRGASVSLVSDLPGGQISIEPGAQIDVGSGGQVALTAGRQILVDGSIRAAAGNVRMSLNSTSLTGATATAENFAGRVIHLGGQAQVDVSGVSTVQTDARGLRRGDVLDAGNVVLSAPLGTVAIDAGATIRANGTADAIDVGPNGATTRIDAASAGGTVALAAQNGLLVDGTIEARGGAIGAAGGNLSVQLSGLTPDQKTVGNIEQPLLDALYSQDRVLTLGAPGAPLPGLGSDFELAQIAGRARVKASLVNGSGFDRVWLSSSNVIETPQSQSLVTRGALVLESQVLRTGDNATLSLNAPTVAIGFGPRSAPPGPGVDAAVRGGSGRLQIDARNVDLVGDLTLQGMSQVDIRAADDLRLRGGGSPTDLRPQGSLTASADINLTAAQVYPVTQTDYTMRVIDRPAGTIRVAASGNAPLDPLSAAGSVTFSAPNYVQTGRVVAPHGAITVQAGDAVQIAPTAELSVAGNALVPYGAVFNRSAWSYSNNPAAIDAVLASPGGATLPDKRIDIAGRNVDIAPGARIDIGGGGELLGAEFVAGPGGSTNVSLNFVPTAPGASTTQRNPLFALVPARGTSLAPFDPLIMSDLTTNAAALSNAGTAAASGANASTLAYGSSITIGPGGPIPAGTYTVMPPRYALLPGAVAVEPVAGLRDIDPARAIQEAAGTTIVAGRLGNADAGTQAARWSGFRIYTRQQFDRLAEFQTYGASAFFGAAAQVAGQPAPRLPVDAGALSVAADALRFGPSIDAAPAAGGRGAELAIAAPSLTVAAGAAPVPDAPRTDVTLSATALDALQAESLILGARAERDDAGNLTLTRTAQRVSVEAGAQLRAGEVLLAASDSVEVGSGARIGARGEAPTTPRIDLTGDGAALLVSNANDVPALVRSGASPAGTAARGDLTIADSARLEGDAVLFDGTREQRFAPSVALSARSVGLSGAVVNFGDVPTGTAGLTLTNALLAQFGSAERFTIRSASGFNFFGNATLGAVDATGAPTLRGLTLDGSALTGRGGSDSTATLTAGQVTLRNSAGSTASAPGDGQGALVINAVGGDGAAGDIVLGEGRIAVSGFNDATLRAQPAPTAPGGNIRFEGSGRLDVSGAVQLAAAQVTAATAADHGVSATGALNLVASGAAGAERPAELGATLTFEGRRVDVSGRIVAPSGVVTLRATGGAASDDVVLADGALVDVAGTTQTFANTRADASAGGIALSSTSGAVRQEAGARLDLRGAGSRGDAGSLVIEAARGTVNLAGEVATAPGSDANGARIAVDAGRLPDLAAVTHALTTGAEGASARSVSVRVRNGDTQLDVDQRIDAHEIVIAADGGESATRPADGQVRVDGRLDAGGVRGGRVEVHARDQVALGATARIDATATGEGEEGGSVLMSAGVHENAAARPALDAIVISDGAQVNVGGTSAALNGTVTLRSARVGNDVAIAALPSSYLQGARQEVIEAVVLANLTGNLSLSPSGASSAANPLPGLRTTLSDYMSAANRAAMTARLNRTGAAAFSLRPGLEIRTPGDINLAAALDFAAGLVPGDTGSPFQWRYGGDTLAASDPGALTLRAGGSININQLLTDGVTGTATGTSPTLRPFATGESWRYQLTAGADRTAANAAATTGTSGNVAVGASGAVRTGTGRIDIAAANDITLASATSVIFSAGVATVNGPTFTNPQVTALSPPPQFTQHGGSVRLAAGRDITSTSGTTQLVNEWLWRVGDLDDSGSFAAGTPTAWWVNVGRFQQGVGALGGGDLSINAGRDINRVGASVPTNAFMQPLGDPADPATGYVLAERNGGALDVRAGRRLSGGILYAQRGDFSVRAGEIDGTVASDQLRLALGNNRADVQAHGDARVVVAFNPTWASPAAAQITGGGNANTPRNVAFATYGKDSAVSVRSQTGDVSFGGSLSSVFGAQLSTNSADRRPFLIAPSTVDLVSFSGDTQIGGSVLMFPDANGQLRMLADGSIGGSGALVMSDLDPASLPSAAAPATLSEQRALFAASGALGSFDLATTQRHASLPEPLHAADAEPVHVVARSGSIESVTFDLPKFAEFSAGQTIGNGARLLVQNANAESVTRIRAGGDIDFSASGGSATDFSIEIRGEGAAEVLAGGAISLGTGGGIVSRGNLANAFLPQAGASLVVAAGLGRGEDGFAQAPDYANALRQFIRFDAFASAGADAGVLNAAVLEDKFDAAIADLLQRALADRAAVDDPNSAISRELAALSPLQLQRAAITLVAQVQRVANERFVATRNTDTFAAGYVALADLFPRVQDYAQGLRQFVLNNPFGVAANADALSEQVVSSLPEAIAQVLRLGLADPASVNDPTSAFSRALSDLTDEALSSAGRELLASSLRVGGAALDDLRAAGRVDPGQGTPFARGLTDLAAAFSPAGAVGANDISLVFSQIKAEQSGDVALFAPRGGVLVGQGNPPAGAIEKRPDQLGILTLGSGDVFGAVRDNFDVFRSRVFTIAGGDIQLWSSLGNIDAGRGPRDVTVAPPPRLSIAPDGSVTFDVTASVSGSGIGALRTRADQPPSDIRLIAPRGFIDAGEAGIRADAGTVTLGTNIVLNAGNISAGGGVAGGAVVVAPAAPVPTSSVSNQATKALEETQRSAAAQQKEAEERAEKERRKRVRGEFIGFGDD